jgi:hypothetical protein
MSLTAFPRKEFGVACNFQIVPAAAASLLPILLAVGKATAETPEAARLSENP